MRFACVALNNCNYTSINGLFHSTHSARLLKYSDAATEKYKSVERFHFLLSFFPNDFLCGHLVNTHMHADHITGTGCLKQLVPGAKSVISRASGAKADQYLDDGDIIRFGRHELKAAATPGHTNGCMTYINHEQVIGCISDAQNCPSYLHRAHTFRRSGST